MTTRLLRSGMGQAGVASVALSAWILVWLPGWNYYRTPIAERGYLDAHALLRPSGSAGMWFGVVGAALMVVPFLYMLRKRLGRRGPGSLKTFLEVHLFCGIVGPVLVTYHTAFKFNGIISAAYWSMVVVVLSGFVGRYLYARIPRSIRGTEMTRLDLDREAEVLREEAVIQAAGSRAFAAIDEAESAAAANSRPSWTGLLFGEWTLRGRTKQLARELRKSGLSPDRQAALLDITRRRALLLRRAAYLEKTKAAFSLWHVFHLPLVYLLGVIVILHVGVVTYLGYVPMRW